MKLSLREVIESVGNSAMDAIHEGRISIAIEALHRLNSMKGSYEKSKKMGAEDSAIFDFNIQSVEDALTRVK